jgi:hypothetical protein
MLSRPRKQIKISDKVAEQEGLGMYVQSARRVQEEERARWKSIFMSQPHLLRTEVGERADGVGGIGLTFKSSPNRLRGLERWAATTKPWSKRFNKKATI